MRFLRGSVRGVVKPKESQRDSMKMEVGLMECRQNASEGQVVSMRGKEV